ncbi:MAG: NAD-specific glutamate dehydrogenase, partial [Chloroflexi bacterium]|nr:NAD-specific glutamate dehydrogenase [Chloroflexota bacterium]
VGSNAARWIHERGGTVIGATDSSGGRAQPGGLDVPTLLEHVRSKRLLVEFDGGERITNQELLRLKCDVLVPCALEEVFDADVAAAVQAQMVVEGANGPTTPAADEVFRKRGITVVPDILANAGGVTVSYFEWVQNLQHVTWTLNDVRTQLGTTMTNAYRSVANLARERDLDLRTSAFIIAVGRVGRAAVLQGV